MWFDVLVLERDRERKLPQQLQSKHVSSHQKIRNVSVNPNTHM